MKIKCFLRLSSLFFLSLAQIKAPLNAQTLPLHDQLWDKALNARDLGQYEKAFELFGQALALVPQKAELYNSRGKTYFDLACSGKFNAQADSLLELAMSDYVKGLGCPGLKNKTKSEILVNRGAIYGVKNQLNLAIQDFTEGLHLDPENKNGYFNRSICHFNLREYEKTIADYTDYLKLDPDNANILYERGMLHRTLSHNKKAIRDLDRAISLKPTFGLAYLERARAFGQAGKKVLARTDFEKAQKFGHQLSQSDFDLIKD